jgi:hypothetical protein
MVRHNIILSFFLILIMFRQIRTPKKSYDTNFENPLSLLNIGKTLHILGHPFVMINNDIIPLPINDIGILNLGSRFRMFRYL